MKKIVFVLVVLLFAAPALARVDITAEQVGNTNEVNITYVTDGNLPRAFGLDITVDYGVITACTSYMVGECTASVQGYGIFPGTIQIDEGGNVTFDGTPVAPSDDPGALGDLDSNGITVEMGSLYVDGNEPDVSGVLCTITVSEECTVSIAGNAARCGETNPTALGVVMVNPDEVPDVNYVEGVVTFECMIVGQTIGDIYISQAVYDLWVSIGTPPEWCCESNSKGDSNLDTFTNASDVVGIVNNLGLATDVTNYLADLNRDGFINPSDVVSIINHLGESVGSCPP